MIKILVATDFSETADNAVEYAAALCSQFNAELILYNAFTVPVHASNSLLSAHSFQDMLDKNRRKLNIQAQTIAQTYGIQVACESTYAFLADELKKILQKYEASLVVIGMSKKCIENDLMGNNTTAVIKQMKFPVLAVPLGVKYTGMKKILFACDVLRGVPVKILEQIKSLSTDLQSEIEVFFVDAKIEELKNIATENLAVNIINQGLEGVTYTHKSVRSTAVIREIGKEIANFKAELLIMVPKKYGFWESLIHRSKTRILASGLQIPLLSIPL